MSDSTPITPAASAALSTTQQPSQSSVVMTTHDSVDTRLTDERVPLHEKGNVSWVNSSQPQDSPVLHILLSVIGIDETCLEQALADETVWLQLRANLILQLENTFFFSVAYWSLALGLVLLSSPTFSFNFSPATPLDPDVMAVSSRIPYQYALASVAFLLLSIQVSYMWCLVLVNFPASSLRKRCRRNETRLMFFFFLALPTYLLVVALAFVELAMAVRTYLASGLFTRVLDLIALAFALVPALVWGSFRRALFSRLKRSFES